MRTVTRLMTGAVLWAVAGGVLTLLVFGAGAAGASVPAPGPLRVVVPGTDTNLEHGGSATEFGLALPGGARCPGDTRHGYYFVWGYLVPSTVTADQVRFDQLLPVQGFDLFYDDGNEPWGPVPTDPGTAQVPDLPNNFSWTRLGAGNLIPAGQASAVWTAAIACADRNEHITNDWEVEVTFQRDTHDPKGYIWDVRNDAPGPGPGFPWLVGGPLALAALFGLATIALRRRARPEIQPRTIGSGSKVEAHV